VKKFIFELGVLDGAHGFVISMQHACYTFQKYAKLWELGKKRK
jgi:(heptosyl)LPS beta-1,4-glucosyltransferase